MYICTRIECTLISSMIKQFHHTGFLPIETLVQKKHENGRRISVIIPALNEAATIGPIIATIRQELVESRHLVDELLVVAGKSSDNTEAVARREGATVFCIDEIGPGVATCTGKGTALWKALHVAQGNIIVSIDADITNFDSRFVYGLIGPLLSDDSISFAKAYYKRPLMFDKAALENYGGRVTEILVRPFLSTFYPELAGLHQPLSGEYSFRRELVDDIQFPSGYSIEIGIILSLYKKYGLDIFA
ncbi:MAG: glucosyl-3-phosphoglycerate synthase, partial [Chitinivibrionales bacterium]|nr:glucosyl-3-phosphoglycerate synthase [Chitinivibrionales bacterium]